MKQKKNTYFQSTYIYAIKDLSFNLFSSIYGHVRILGIITFKQKKLVSDFFPHHVNIFLPKVCELCLRIGTISLYCK